MQVAQMVRMMTSVWNSALAATEKRERHSREQEVVRVS